METAENNLKPVTKAQIYYLEILKKRGLLELAMTGQLPDEVHRAAKIVAAARHPGAPFDKKTLTFLVNANEQAQVDREVEEYLLHYRMGKRITIVEEGDQIYFPREILKNKKYVVRSGLFKGKAVLIRGLDKDVYGVGWIKNFGNPACEALLFRAEKDKLPVRGRFFVGMIGSEDVILHEKEIGGSVQ